MRVVTLSLLMLALLAGPLAAAGEQWLQYRTVDEPSDLVTVSGSAAVEVVAERPADLQLPPFTGAKPLLARWKTPLVKAGFLWLALDQSNKGGAYDRLYFDTNCDGRLSDETAVTPGRARGDGSYRTRFGPLKLTFAGDDGPITYHLIINHYLNSDGPVRLTASPACWYEGRVTVAGRERLCQVCDTTANGAFGDAGGDGEVDRFRLEETKKGGDGQETFIPVSKTAGKYTQVDSKFYALEIARDGSWIKFSFDENLPLGKVRLPKVVKGLGLIGKMGWLRLTADDEGLVRAPLGSYIFDFWSTADRADAGGRMWYLIGQALPAEKAFEVTLDREVVLSIGEPNFANLKMSGQGTTHLFNLDLRGRMGEPILLRLKGDGPVRVTLRLKNAGGDYDKTMSFEYG